MFKDFMDRQLTKIQHYRSLVDSTLSQIQKTIIIALLYFTAGTMITHYCGFKAAFGLIFIVCGVLYPVTADCKCYLDTVITLKVSTIWLGFTLIIPFSGYFIGVHILLIIATFYYGYVEMRKAEQKFGES